MEKSTPIASDNDLLDLVKRHFDLPNDFQLSKRIGIDDGNLSKIRSGERPLSPIAKLKCYDVLGYVWAREAMLFLFPEDTASKVRESDNARTKAADERRAKKKAAVSKPEKQTASGKEKKSEPDTGRDFFILPTDKDPEFHKRVKKWVEDGRPQKTSARNKPRGKQ